MLSQGPLSLSWFYAFYTLKNEADEVKENGGATASTRLEWCRNLPSLKNNKTKLMSGSFVGEKVPDPDASCKASSYSDQGSKFEKSQAYSRALTCESSIHEVCKDFNESDVGLCLRGPSKIPKGVTEVARSKSEVEAISHIRENVGLYCEWRYNRDGLLIPSHKALDEVVNHIVSRHKKVPFVHTNESKGYSTFSIRASE
jgi:hypothetical protein